jgi:hypothetical protein
MHPGGVYRASCSSQGLLSFLKEYFRDIILANMVPETSLKIGTQGVDGGMCIKHDKSNHLTPNTM